MWRELVEVYAVRAREFSDAVARLGQHEDSGPEFEELMGEIKRRHALCMAATDELERYLEQRGESTGTGS